MLHQQGDTHAALEGAAEALVAKPDLDNEQYVQQQAAANAEANAEKYQTQGDTSQLVMRHDALHRKDDVTRVERHKKLGKAEFESRQQELEGTLFEMFKEKERWKVKEVAVR